MFIAKGDAHSDEPRENYDPPLLFPSASQRVLASFSSLFWFYISQLSCLVHSHRTHQLHFQPLQGAVFSEKHLNHTLSSQRQWQSGNMSD